MVIPGIKQLYSMNKLNYQDPAGGGEGGGLSRFQVTGIKFSIPGFFWTVLLWVA